VEAHEVRNIPFQEPAADRLLAQKSSALHGVEAKRGSSIYSRLSTLYTDGQSTSGHHPPTGEHWIWRSHITVASGRYLGTFIEPRLYWHDLSGPICAPVLDHIATQGIQKWVLYCAGMLE